MSIIEDRIERLCGDITELRLKLARYMNPYTIEHRNMVEPPARCPGNAPGGREDRRGIEGRPEHIKSVAS